MNHAFFMQRCLDLASLGLAQAAPNPSVGAVLVYQNSILAEGYTSAYGGAHAEVNCLKQVKAQDAHLIPLSRLYVSLEPCSHFGKTPPCSNLIIEKNIPEVIIACKDPNPLVAGKGIQKLKDANIKVVENILEKEAQELNKRFFCFHQNKRPYITLKWAQTPQGFFAPDHQEQFWITQKTTKAFVHALRSQEMGILVGENTILADNPRLNTRLVAGKSPIRIIINSKQKLPANSAIFNGQQPTLVFTNQGYQELPNVQFISLNENENIVNQVLSHLHQMQINSILVEGGAFTLQSFIAQKLWDECVVLEGSNELHEGILAPKIEGKLIDTFSLGSDLIKIYKNDLALT